MPRTTFPPTPATSVDILAECDATLPHPDSYFSLGPSAISPSSSLRSDGLMDNENHGAKTIPPTPFQPSAAANERSRRAPCNDARLPPPPTRSRKIIQMKPENQPKRGHQKETLSTIATKQTAPEPANGKKKQAGSSAGRKIARRTAHSLIERKRRSKMNQEFSVLKDMIPACKGHEMHKLAILQASTDYLRYLQKCVEDLKASNSQQTGTVDHGTSLQCVSPSSNEECISSDNDSDDEMEDSGEPKTSMSTSGQTLLSPVSLDMSPVVSAVSSRHGHYSHPSDSSPSLFSPHLSQHPFFGYYSQSSYAVSPPMRSLQSNSTSPALPPQHVIDSDHEASTALLMLNATDRRSTMHMMDQERSRVGIASGDGPRGLSVKDLLRS